MDLDNLSEAELEDIAKKIAEAGDGPDSDILKAVALGQLKPLEAERIQARRERARAKAAKKLPPRHVFQSKPFGLDKHGVTLNMAWPKDRETRTAMKKAQRRIRHQGEAEARANVSSDRSGT